MSGLRLTCWSALLVLLVAGRGGAGPLTTAARKADERLKHPVSVKSDRMYVGDLVAALAQQSGITIECALDQGAADDLVAVALNEVPVSEAMDSLWSLLSYRGAEWSWERTGRPGQYRYVLERPRVAREFTSRMRAETQNSYEAQTERLVTAALLPLDRLRGLARDDAEAAMLVQSQSLREGLRTLAEVLTPEERQRVLRGSQEFEVPVSRLSESGRAFVRSIWSSSQALRKGADGVFEPVPEPTSIHIYSHRPGSNLSPVLFLALEGLGGYGYSGGMPLQRELLARLKELWRLPGDESSSTLEDRLVPLPSEPLPPLVTPWAQAVRLGQAAGGTGVPFLARLSEDQRRDIGSPHGSRLGTYLAKARESSPYLDHKWRGKILLVSYPAWYMVDTDAVKPPWTVVRELRSIQNTAGGVLPVSALDRAADRLSVAQLERLGVEFLAMRGVVLWQELFRFRARFPHLARQMDERGMLVVDLLRLLPPTRSARVSQLLAQEGAYSIRLEVEEYLESPKPAREIRFRVFSADGRSVGVGGFRVDLPASAGAGAHPR